MDLLRLPDVNELTELLIDIVINKPDNIKELKTILKEFIGKYKGTSISACNAAGIIQFIESRKNDNNIKDIINIFLY